MHIVCVLKQVTKEFFAALSSLQSQCSVVEAMLDVLQSRTDTAIATLIRKKLKHVSGWDLVLVYLDVCLF